MMRNIILLIITLASSSQQFLTSALSTEDFKLSKTKINSKLKQRNHEMQLDDIVQSNWYQSLQLDQDENVEPNIADMKDQSTKSQSPKVSVPISEIWEPYYFWLRNYDAFDAGFKFEDYWSNTSNCYFRMTNYTFIQKPQWEVYKNSSANTGYQIADNTTALISNTSDSLWYCTGMLRSWYEWVQDEQVAFNHSWGNYMSGFFNNLLANVISFNNIYTSIDDNHKAGNDTGVIYDTGRLLRIMFIFDPVEPVDSLYNSDVPIQSIQKKFRGETKNQFEAELQRFIIDWIQSKPKDERDSEQQSVALLDQLKNQIDKKIKINEYLSLKKPENHTFGEQLEPGVLWNMTKGFLNSTGITYGGNRTGCEEAMVNIRNGTIEGKDLFFLEFFNFTNILNGTDEFLLVGYNLNGITFDCYWGYEESKEIANEYYTTISNVDDLIFNLQYNLGKIYTQTFNIYAYFNRPRISTIKTWWQLGYAYGKFFSYMFYPTEDLINEQGAGAHITDTNDDDDEDSD